MSQELSDSRDRQVGCELLREDVGSRLRTIMGDRCLQIFGPESGVFGDASQHLGANFLSVMKCEDEIRPTFATEGAM